MPLGARVRGNMIEVVQTAAVTFLAILALVPRSSRKMRVLGQSTTHVVEIRRPTTHVVEEIK